MLLRDKMAIGAFAALVTVTLFGILFSAAKASEAEDYRVAENRQNILEAQRNAEGAHKSLSKAKAAVEAAVEAENEAQKIVDSYSATADTARKNICNLSKEACTRENLDPASSGVNLDDYLL